jgi:hypothetical protein
MLHQDASLVQGNIGTFLSYSYDLAVMSAYAREIMDKHDNLHDTGHGDELGASSRRHCHAARNINYYKAFRVQVTHKTTNKSATAPPFPISTAAAAGAASPALVCCAERGNGNVGNNGCFYLGVGGMIRRL